MCQALVLYAQDTSMKKMNENFCPCRVFIPVGGSSQWTIHVISRLHGVLEDK